MITVTKNAPITWIPPATFNAELKGLGLPQLEGIEHRIIYHPKWSNANVDEGGNGVYESLEHGTFCHGPSPLVVGDHIVVTWTNHTRDEGGPGLRKISRVGRIIDGGREIDFGGPERLTQVAAPPIPPRRRSFNVDPVTMWPYVGGSLNLISGKLYLMGSLTCAIGYTNGEQYRMTSGPVPEEHFRDSLDIEAGYNFDKWASLGFSFVQRFRIEGDHLVEDSPLYQRSPLIERFEVTPGRFKTTAPLQEPYLSAIPFENAPSDFKKDVLEGIPEQRGRSPKFRDGEKHLSADGMHALAHASEFRRPDGSWVVIRDNLLNPGYYYASEKPSADDYYPPGIETNLYGGANPAAGELPDGRPFIVCNSFDDYYRAADRSRKDMFFTISRDGRVFDRTWLLLHDDGNPDGGIYKFGGPQYFRPLILGPNMWIFYSITKQREGLTKLPLDLLA